MRTSRRHFLRAGLLGAAGLALLPERSNADVEATVSLFEARRPVLQVYTDATTAQFRILVESPDMVSYRVVGPDGTDLPLSLLYVGTNPYDEMDNIVHLRVEGLQPGLDYRLQIFDVRAPKQPMDERIFRSLELAGTKARFALLSCMNDDFSDKQQKMWGALARAKPDVVLLLGDTCYSDLYSGGNERGYWKRFGQTRRELNHFYWKRLIPTLAIWDDHDFGGNNIDSTATLKDTALKCFKMYFESSPGIGLEHGPGVSQLFRFRGQRFFLMDDRYFRDPPGRPKGTHWGQLQEDWLFSKLQETHEPAWILNGSQFFGGYRDKDSFEQLHPWQFRRVLERLRTVKVPVVLGSGDVHFSEIMRIEPAVLGYQTVEITSSSMHSYTFPFHQHRYNNPRRVDSTWKHNFVLVESEVVGSGLAMRIRSQGEGLETYFDRRVTVQRPAKIIESL